MKIRIPFVVFVVATDPTAARHHGLHTNTSPHVLTARPEAGDRIVARLDGDREVEPLPDGSWRTTGVSLLVEGRVERHGGRSALLGEDGFEDAFGGDALEELVPEIIDGCDWNYAPVTYVPPLSDEECIARDALDHSDERYLTWARKKGRLVRDRDEQRFPCQQSG